MGVMFIISLILLALLFPFIFIGIMVISVLTTKKIFNMNEEKWDYIFKYKDGRGLYYMIALCYIIAVVFMIPLSIIWFNFINFEYSIFATVVNIVILMILGVFKLHKIKIEIKNRLNKLFSE